MKLDYQNYVLGLLLCIPFFATAQVGINTTNPQAQLDITASNGATPSNKDGLLIPRVNTFPATNPTASQQGMLVYLTTTVGLKAPGFYYWDNITTNWVSISQATLETDPQVSSTTTSYVPRWNGTSLVDGQIYDNGSNVSIGTTTTTGKFNVEVSSGKYVVPNWGVSGSETILGVYRSNTTDGAQLRFDGSTPEYTDIGRDNFGNFVVQQNDSKKLVVTPLGNIGIGTTNPTDKVHVVGNVKIDGGKLPFVNTGESVFIGESAGQNDDLSNNANTFIGNNSGKININGRNNVGVGAGTLENSTTSHNTAVGRLALNALNSGYTNVAIGESSIRASTSGIENTALGTNSLRNNVTGNGNTALGFYAGYNNLGSGNVFIGRNAGQDETGNDKLYIDNSLTPNPLIYGDFATNLLRVNGTLNINNAYNLPANAGAANQILQTNGAGLASWVNASTLTITENDPKVGSTTANYIPKWNGTNLIDGQIFDNGTAVGVGTSTPTDKIHVVGNLKIDGGKIPFVNTGNSVFIGQNAGQNDDLTTNENVFIGHDSGRTNITGFSNTGIGKGALQNSTGSINTAVGRNALNTLTTGGLNTAIGEAALLSATTSSSNTAIGGSALRSNITGNFNVAIGKDVGFQNNGANNTFIGGQSGFFNTGSRNVFLGYSSGYNETGDDKLYIDNTNTSNPLIYGDFSTDLLRINGTLNVNNAYSLPTIAGVANQILQTNGAGVTSWVNASTLTIAENDPKVGSTALNKVAKWNGSTLVDGLLFDNGNRIGIGTNNPSALLSVGSNMSTFGLINSVVINTTGNAPLFVGETTGGKGIILGYDGNNIQGRSGVNFATNGDLVLNNYGGNVGVGTLTPTQAKLVVNGSENNTLAYGYLNSAGSTGSTGSSTNPYSIYASQRIAATEFNAFSDTRIKKILSRSKSNDDLAIISKIQITNYKHIDTIANPNKIIKKVIAQELKVVYPNAVSTHQDFIPNVYQLSEIKNGSVTVANDFKAGDSVKLIFTEGEEIVTIKSATSTRFEINSNKSGKVFVYGKRVNDFHTVDYEALSTLNISATQELLKRIEDLEKEKYNLKTEIQNLKTEVSTLKDIKTDVENLKLLLNKSADN
jgi:hypothetical protein